MEFTLKTVNISTLELMLRRSILFAPTEQGDMIMTRVALALTLALSTLTGIAGAAYARPYHAAANPAIQEGLKTENMSGGS